MTTLEAATGRKPKHDANAVLNLWAANRSAKDIAAELKMPSHSTVNTIIAEARRVKDPRALRRYSTAEAAAMSAPQPRRLYSFLGVTFVARTLFIPTMGTSSRNCVRVPVSVSSLPDYPS